MFPWPEIITTGKSGCISLRMSRSCSPSRAASLHPDVQEHQVGTSRLDRGDSLVAVACGSRAVTLVLQDSRHKVSNVGLVVDDENVAAHDNAPSDARSFILASTSAVPVSSDVLIQRRTQPPSTVPSLLT